MRREVLLRLVWVAVFGVAFGFVESAVVVYLRALYYPEGFVFPLKLFTLEHFVVEFSREAATIVMLTAIAFLAGVRRWERFGYFLVAFGVWDVFYYVWLNILIGWPASLSDWDVLFLIPLPWIGPVLAPLTIALVMVGAGILMVYRVTANLWFQASAGAWVLATVSIGLLIFSFMSDTGATVRGAVPQSYRYEFLGAGMVFGISAFLLACGVFRGRRGLRAEDDTRSSPRDS